MKNPFTIANKPNRNLIGNASTEMVFTNTLCENCGKPLLKGANFCIKCGSATTAAFRSAYKDDRNSQEILARWKQQRKTLEDYQDNIQDESIRSDIELLVSVIDKIMGQVRQDPGCSKHVTKLSETFLPIVVNTIATYTACCDIGVTNAEEMARLNESVINGLKYTTRACYTIINNINEDDMVSATLDVSVMKQLMEQEGILPEDIID